MLLLVRGLLAGALLLLAPYSALATPLGLASTPPDIVSSFINVGYDSGTDTLSASGFALELDLGGPTEAIAGGTFDLSAIIDIAGNLIGGTLSIGGTIASQGFTSGTLLTASLTDIGFVNAGGDPLEFLGSVTGGDAAGLFGGLAGVILSDAGFGGSFANDFANNGDGNADTFSVAEPALMLSGLAALGTALLARRSRA